MHEALTTPETAQLEAHEATIKQGLETFYEVGNALLAIRDGRLYRRDFKTFEEYCRSKWGMVASRARQLIGAAGVAANLEGVTNVTLSNESQARALASLASETQQLVWEYAVKAAPVVDDEPKVTAAHIRKAAYTVEILKSHGWQGEFTRAPVLLIDEEFHSIMPPIDEETRAGMESSILKLGVINPLDVWGNTILDGHERFFICMRLGIPFEVVQRSCADRDATILFIYESQLMRKNYTPSELDGISSMIAARVVSGEVNL
ncbi:MAG TPA: hypothetical protein VGN95_25295 [Pyrinomonadaceae bacterium]|jgi:hypothetical protein|nr:hypothetical protein [Pyrinomonadaceae bacterium]